MLHEVAAGDLYPGDIVNPIRRVLRHGRSLTPFLHSTHGQLATIGRHAGVAMVCGVRFSGVFAWWLWRTVYLMKLPRLTKKLRVLVAWTLDLFFGREIGHMVTARDVDAVMQRLERIRARDARQKSACVSAGGRR
jgi:NADH dehydrogenase FAD-containing subunit